MNLTTSKKDILHLATRAAGVAEKRSAMPALALALLDASGDRLRCSATDLFMAFRSDIQAEVNEDGGIAVNPRDLVERLKHLADGPVTLTTKDDTLTLKGASSARRFTMRGLSATDYPPLPRPDDTSPVMTIAPEILANLIAMTSYAVSLDETRVHLNSALVEWDGDTVRMVATDGHRLSKVERKISGSASSTMLIPLRALNEIRRMVDDLYTEGIDGGAELKIVQTGPNVFFIGGGATFSVKLVDAHFPPYAQVIPTTSAKIVRIGRASLLDAVKAVAVSANASGAVRMSFSKGVLRLSSEDPKGGDGADEVPIDYAGPGMSIGFAAKFLIEPLGAMATDEVELGLSGELDPMTMTPIGDGAGNVINVLMPMRI